MNSSKANFLFISFLFFISMLVFSSSANAVTFVVNTTADTVDAVPGDGNCLDAGGACSLRAAITEANTLAGADVITLPAGTYTTTIAESATPNDNLSGDFDILSDITINGAGSGSTIVEANAAPGVATWRVFHVRFTAPSTVAVINDVTIRHGRYASNTFGAGVRVDVGAASLTLNRCVVRDNLNGSSGGGISVSSATNAILNINDSTITANGAGSAIAATSANGAGIQINNAATVTIANTTISNNASNNAIAASAGSVFGGGLFIGNGTTTITNSTISGNSTALSGAGATGFAYAGGIYNQQATLNLTNSSVTGNTSGNFHAGIRTLAGTIAAATNITNSTISGNIANGTEGGGVINIATNTANSTTNIVGSTVSGNRVLGVGGLAGGLENFASAGIAGLSVMNVTNSTVSGNLAPGAAASFNTGASATINYNFATVASNTATTAGGGGIAQDINGTTNLKNSIVADNTAVSAPDISGTITSQDYNHVENTSGGTFLGPNFLPLPNDVTGTDPALGPLANNGGPTLTHSPGVPVINLIPNGTNDCGTLIVNDQRNGFRPAATGLACEKGAVEFGPTAAGVSISGRITDASGYGIRNVRVSIVGSELTQPRTAITNAFGYYSIDDLEVGSSYVISVAAKGRSFVDPTRIISLTDVATNIDFVTSTEPFRPFTK